MDFDGLKTRIATRLNRSDLTSEIPGFIASAEDVMNAVLRRDPVRPMMATATSNVSSDSFALPADCIDIIQINASDSTESWELVRVSPRDNLDWQAERALPYGEAYDNSRPKIYRVVGDTAYLPFAPTEGFTATLDYYQEIPALASDNTSNWMLANHAIVYEHGALAAAYAHLRDEGAEAKYKNDFLEGLNLVLGSYPETGNPANLRLTDSPLVSTRWSIING